MVPHPVKATAPSVVTLAQFFHKTLVLLKKLFPVENLSSLVHLSLSGSQKTQVLCALFYWNANTIRQEKVETSMLSSSRIANLSHCVTSCNTCFFKSSAMSSVHLPTLFTDKGVHFCLLPCYFACIISVIFFPWQEEQLFPQWYVAFCLSLLPEKLQRRLLDIYH